MGLHVNRKASLTGCAVGAPPRDEMGFLTRAEGREGGRGVQMIIPFPASGEASGGEGAAASQLTSSQQHSRGYIGACARGVRERD